jgi:tetratricopeptide (TPR) repeat protein
MRPVLTLSIGLVCITPAAPVLAQEHDHQHAYVAAPAKVGRVKFPSGCAPAVQPKVERAVALLHSFWYEEAENAFGEVTRADPGCAIGYWGQAMSLLHPLWAPPISSDASRGLAAAERAVESSRPGTRQRDYAEAITTFWRGYNGPPDFRARLAAYETAMERVARRHAGDAEAKTFYALALIGVGQLDAGDTTYARQRKAGAILEPLLARSPDHPGLAHYVIHAYDSPALAARAVPAAERYAAIAPSVPHAQHMPSHIYTRVGNWTAAMESNRRSADAGRTFEQRLGMPGLWDQRAHAWDYLMYAYLQLGMEREAKALRDSALAVSASVPENALTTDYALAAIPARYALERNAWAEAARLQLRPAPSWRATEGITRFARALGAARSGAPAQARAELDSLAALERAVQSAGGAQAYWATQVTIMRLAAGAWVTLAEGDTTRALQQARDAAELDDRTEKHPVTPGAVLPPRELYGEMLLLAGQRAEAARAFESALTRQPGRARSVAGMKRAGAGGNGREQAGTGGNGRE